jgi:uncharacterized Zn finger protein (UPF0148 family)
MTALTCDVCGSNLSTGTDGADFVVCELCGARKVLGKAEEWPAIQGKRW